MFIRLRRLLESLSPKLGEAGDEDENVVEAEEVRITEITTLEELVNERTKDLEEAREQLRQLSSSMYSAENGKDEAMVKSALNELLKPESGLVLQTVKTSLGEDKVQAKEASAQLIKPEKEFKVETVKISPEGKGEELVKQVVQPVEAKEPNTLSKKIEGEEKKPKEAAQDMISQIFSREEEVTNPLASLVTALPEVAAKELLREAHEIEAMLGEWGSSQN